PNAAGILEKNGKEFRMKILDREKSTERYFTFFMESAKKVGIVAELESTDLAGWSARMDKFDFDLTWTAWGGGVFKDPEPMWHSKYAKEEGQHNYPGIEIPAVDALVEKQKTVFDVEERNRIVKEIDRIIYTEYPYVLLWHLDNTRLMFWNRFGMPENPLGLYGGESFALEYWWFDENRNKALIQAYENKTALPAVPANAKLN
ncbi:MAG TPA: ABC transporter substrate-binding protein, partial [Leptospiraceae bacterium]|nr:ABC transporter substrate-binding protein [Leptospiraceae bacterium]